MPPSPQNQGPPAGGGNFLLQKTGPLPNWAWGAVALGLALVYAWWKNRQSNAAASAAASSNGTTSTAADNTPGTGLVPGVIVQQFSPPAAAAPAGTSTPPTSGTLSNPLFVEQLPNTAPAPGIIATPQTGGKLVVAFGSVPGVKQYKLYVYGPNNTPFLAKVYDTIHPPVITGLKKGTKYTAWVAPVGTSTQSKKVTFTAK